MKKVLSIILFMLGISAFADDSYLYWMIDYQGYEGWDTFKLAAISVDGQTTTYLDIYGDYSDPESLVSDNQGVGKSDYDSWVEARAEEGFLEPNPSFYASLSGISDIGSFVLELFNGTSVVKSSDPLTYSAAAAYIGGPGIDIPSALPYTFTVPEPTSGMLVLIGGVLMALRRKRKIVA